MSIEDGFTKRAADYGLSQSQARALFKQANIPLLSALGNKAIEFAKESPALAGAASGALGGAGIGAMAAGKGNRLAGAGRGAVFGGLGGGLGGYLGGRLLGNGGDGETNAQMIQDFRNRHESLANEARMLYAPGPEAPAAMKNEWLEKVTHGHLDMLKKLRSRGIPEEYILDGTVDRFLYNR